MSNRLVKLERRLENFPGSIPVSSLLEIIEPQNRMHDIENAEKTVQEKEENVLDDFISRNVIPLASAEKLFEYYRDRLDKYIYEIAQTYTTLETVRSKSEFLAVSICTVSALHHAECSELYDLCYKVLLRLSSEKMTQQNFQLADVVAYCIGAFWLFDLSSLFVSNAHHISSELGLHHSYAKAIQGDHEHFERLRLWYLVYVCDHHFSIVYGHASKTRMHKPLSNWRPYAKCCLSSEADKRLITQICLWEILDCVFQSLGADVDERLSDGELNSIRKFREEVISFGVEWHNKLARNKFIGNYPSKGLTLHTKFAELYIASHAFRGFKTKSIDLPADLSHIACKAAMSIVQTIVHDDELQDALIGLPLYFSTMIAFTAVSLVKMILRYSNESIHFRIETINELKQLASKIRKVCTRPAKQHVIKRISQGLDDLLASSTKTLNLDKQSEPLGVTESDIEALFSTSIGNDEDEWWNNVLQGILPQKSLNSLL